MRKFGGNLIGVVSLTYQDVLAVILSYLDGQREDLLPLEVFVRLLMAVVTTASELPRLVLYLHLILVYLFRSRRTISVLRVLEQFVYLPPILIGAVAVVRVLSRRVVLGSLIVGLCVARLSTLVQLTLLLSHRVRKVVQVIQIGREPK